MKTWLEASKVYFNRRIIIILLLGFSSGLPRLLVASTLSLWLERQGVSLESIGFASLVLLPYACKFLWAPVIDRSPLPFITRYLGQRRGWIIFTQILLMVTIFAMATTDPANNLAATVWLALLVSFASASQDIVIDAYRVEILEDEQQGAGAASIVLGYRIGMLVAGAGALWLASLINWQQAYMVMAVLVVVGMIGVFIGKEPQAEAKDVSWQRKNDPLAWVHMAVVAPFKDFALRPGWGFILLFVMFYKLGEAYLGVMANPFYAKMGFSNVEIANISKIFGLGATLSGAVIGGIMVSRYGIMRSLMICGILQIGGTLMFVIQALVGHDVSFLMLTIAAENITASMATSAFVAYLSSLCHQAYTATQYALLSSLMAFAPGLLAASSGWAAAQMGWVGFFVLSAALALPGLLILWWIMRRYAADKVAII